MKRLFLPLIVIIFIAPVLMQCEKRENNDDSIEDSLVYLQKWFTQSDGLAGNYVSAIAVDKEGNKWFGTDMGVSKFDGNTWTTYTTSDGLVCNHVISIAIDHEGNLWFGTSEGVSNFDGNVWKNYMNSDGISLNNVYRIAGDKKGNMWFLMGENVSKFDGRKWTNYKYPTSSESFCEFSFSDKYEWDRIATIDAQDNLWVIRRFVHYESGCGGDICPTWSWNNIIFFDGKKWTTVYGDCPSENSFGFSSLAIDKENNKWFGTNQGVKKLSN